MITKLRLRRSSMVVYPTRPEDLEKSASGDWIIKGGDPKLHLSFGPFCLAQGIYSLDFGSGKGLPRCHRPSLYVDYGEGFSEGTKIPLQVKATGDGVARGQASFPSKVYGLRFDPSDDGVECSFSLTSVFLKKLADGGRSKRAQRDADVNVIINLTRLLPHRKGAGGAGRMVTALLKHIPENTNVRVLVHESNLSLGAYYPNAEFKAVSDGDDEAFKGQLEWCTSYFDPLNGLRPKYIPSRVRVVAMIHDLQHLVKPHFFSDEEVTARDLEYGYILNRADALVSNSAYEVRNLMELCDCNKSTVMHLSGFLADDVLLENPSVHAHGGDTYIFPAVPWSHKNHFILLDALCIAKIRYKTDIKLKLSNLGSSPAHKALIEEHVATLGLQDQIVLSDFLEEDELLEALLGAKGLIFPSLYEGFGIPLVDAMKLGIPVLASKMCAIPEICEDSVAYLSNAENAFVVADDIVRFDRDENLRQDLIDRGLRRAASFSSERMAATLFNVMETAKDHPEEPVLFRPLRRRNDSPPINIVIVVSRDCRVDPQGQSHLSTLRSAAGANIKWILCADVRHPAIGGDAFAGFAASFDSAACFDSDQSSSLETVMQMIQKRFCSGKYQLVVNENQIGHLSWHKLQLAVCSLEREPEARYAISGPQERNGYVLARKTLEESVLAFDTSAAGCTVVFDRMIRLSGPLREHANGSLDFLKEIGVCCYIELPK